MVTKPDVPNPPGPTGLRPHPTVIKPATVVSGKAGAAMPGDDVANKDRTGSDKFKLPEKVTPQEIKDQSFRYGGGRSAGNRSMAANRALKEDQQ